MTGARTELPPIGSHLWRFHGGVKLRHWKKISLESPLAPIAIPPRLVLPVSQSQGSPSQPIVAVGDRVVRGQRLAEPATGSFGAMLHAPAAGTVTAVEDRDGVDPLGMPVRCIEIETDGSDEEIRLPPIEDWAQASADTLRERIREAGIVGLGGAVFPTHVKADPPGPIELLVINGAECEPYIACDEVLMRSAPDRVVRGSEILARVMGAQQIVIAIEDQMGAVERVLRDSVERMEARDVRIVKVPTIYPEGGEKQLIQVLTGREVPSGGIPPDIGVACVNVGTAAAVSEAVTDGRPLVSRIVTITGRGVHSPRNMEVLIGTPISALIEAAGGYTPAFQRLVMGGPMMGIPLPSNNIPVTKATNCVLALIDRDVETRAPELPCIRCMACVTVCPAQLLPQQLYWYIRAEDFEQVERHALFDCIECGCCAYVCPSQLPLVDYYRYAKTEIRVRALERAKADHARARFEARAERLERERRAREQRLEAKRAALKDGDRQAAIAAAIERAKRKKSGGSGDGDR